MFRERDAARDFGPVQLGVRTWIDEPQSVRIRIMDVIDRILLQRRKILVVGRIVFADITVFIDQSFGADGNIGSGHFCHGKQRLHGFRLQRIIRIAHQKIRCLRLADRNLQYGTIAAVLFLDALEPVRIGFDILGNNGVTAIGRSIVDRQHDIVIRRLFQKRIETFFQIPLDVVNRHNNSYLGHRFILPSTSISDTA